MADSRRDDFSSKKKTDDDFDYEGSGSGASFLQPVTIICEHVVSWSKFRVHVQVTKCVQQLKVNFQYMLNVLPEDQEWFYKTRKLEDIDTIQGIGIRRNEIILCQNKSRTSNNKVVLFVSDHDHET